MSDESSWAADNWRWACQKKFQKPLTIFQHLFSEILGFRLFCLYHFVSHRHILILHRWRLNSSSLLSKLLNLTLRASISISVGLTVCLPFWSLLLFIHPQTPLTFPPLVLRCPPSLPSTSHHFSPSLSGAWRIVASSLYCWPLQWIKI